jgi:hypothetical protein
LRVALVTGWSWATIPMPIGDNGALGMLARNHWGWDRQGATTMALSVPPANSDVLDENGEAKIIIELVKAPKRED